jgi:hypothetical protein
MTLAEITWTRGQVAMGIDNGILKHYVIMTPAGIIEYGKTPDWKVIQMLIDKYDPIFVVDLNPDKNGSRELVQHSRGRGYASFYKVSDGKDMDLIEWGEGERNGMVYPNRNVIFDDLIQYIFSGKMKFFGPRFKWEEYISHWETMYRTDVLGTKEAEKANQMAREMGQVRSVWVSSTGMDHFAHATLYAYVALTRVLRAGGAVILGSTANSLQEIMQSEGGLKTAANVAQDGSLRPKRDYLKESIARALNTTTSGDGSASDTIR